MNTSNNKLNSIDEYINAHNGDVKMRLIQLRHLVVTCSPDAVESIAYWMPAYKLNKKPLIYFAAFDHHIGVYATPSAHESFVKELAWYKQGKWSVQFPYDQPLPIDLIEKIIMFKSNEIHRARK